MTLKYLFKKKLFMFATWKYREDTRKQRHAKLHLRLFFET